MLQYIAEREERGTTPNQGWYYWLTHRYTPEATNEFLEQWHESTCDIELVQKVKDALGMKHLPEHIAKFGKFMLWRAKQEITPEDVVKAYTITVASVHRSALDVEKLRRTWPDHPFVGKTVRPEDAWAYMLTNLPEGKRYVEAAAHEDFDAEAARGLLRRFHAYGMGKTLYGQMLHAPRLAKQAAEIQALLRRGSKREWTGFVAANALGIKYAKAGFLASLLGRGDIPTADARENAIWAPWLDLNRSKGLNDEYLDYLDGRLRELNVQVPEELRPFYQHLVHHAVWDRTEDAETSHAEIVRCMVGSALAEEVKEFTGEGFTGARRFKLKPVCATAPDPHQLTIGRKIELEHTNDPEIADMIARHHICEYPDYYDPWLLDMERQAKAYWRRRTR